MALFKLSLTLSTASLGRFATQGQFTDLQLRKFGIRIAFRSSG
jgi:hypothetical protein